QRVTDNKDDSAPFSGRCDVVLLVPSTCQMNAVDRALSGKKVGVCGVLARLLIVPLLGLMQKLDCTGEMDDDTLARLQGQATVDSTSIVPLTALVFGAGWQRHETGPVAAATTV